MTWSFGLVEIFYITPIDVLFWFRVSRGISFSLPSMDSIQQMERFSISFEIAHTHLKTWSTHVTLWNRSEDSWISAPNCCNPPWHGTDLVEFNAHNLLPSSASYVSSVRAKEENGKAFRWNHSVNQSRVQVNTLYNAAVDKVSIISYPMWRRKYRKTWAGHNSVSSHTLAEYSGQVDFYRSETRSDLHPPALSWTPSAPEHSQATQDTTPEESSG